MAATGFASALPWQGLPAPCQLLPAALAVGSSRAGAWVPRDHQVSSGQCRYSTERGRSRAGHTGSPHIASSSGWPNSSVSQADANQSLAALVPGAETLLAVVAPEVLAGAVSAPVCRVCPRAVENLTPSLSLQARGCQARGPASSCTPNWQALHYFTILPRRF